MERSSYPSDVTDGQWRLIEPSIPPPKPGGRPREVDMREVINGILYLVRTGCSWRQLPHDFPPWENGFSESFNSRFRDELLNGELFTSLQKTKVVTEDDRSAYHHRRPHSSLGYQPRAAFAASCRAGCAAQRLRSARPTETRPTLITTGR